MNRANEVNDINRVKKDQEISRAQEDEGISILLPRRTISSCIVDGY